MCGQMASETLKASLSQEMTASQDKQAHRNREQLRTERTARFPGRCSGQEAEVPISELTTGKL